MIYSWDPVFTGASWEPYGTSAVLTLPMVSGFYHVYAKFRDAQNRESGILWDTIQFTSMTIIPGETLLICEMAPALYAAIAANEAERRAPGLTLVDVQMIGAAGRIYLSGNTTDVARARRGIEEVLSGIGGRDA